MERKREAIALKFDPDVDQAPVVFLKGEGVVADALIETARTLDKPVLTRPELIDLLRPVPVGVEIPEGLYRAVSVIFATLYKLEKEKEGRSDR